MLALVEDVMKAVAVAPLLKRSVDKAAFITALYAPTVKFCFEQLSRLIQASEVDSH